MRRRYVLAILIALAIAPVAFFPAAAQDRESDFGRPSRAEQFEGVARPGSRMARRHQVRAPFSSPMKSISLSSMLG
jgi:hypothetical protein